MKDFIRRPSAVAVADSTSSSANVNRILKSEPSLASLRMSILPSVRIPLLRRLESEAAPSHKKQPLLSLRLSSNSFLDSTVNSTTADDVLYQIKTSGTSTDVLRADKKHVFVRAASVKWPRVLPPQGKDVDSVLVQMEGGRWIGRDSLLKPPTVPQGTKKFNIPEYSQPMKWRRYGSGTVYWCTTTAVKGPIAVLETAKGLEPIKLTFYETLHDKYEPGALTRFQGVSILLLDYVLLTSLLLVTDVQEWKVIQKHEERDAVIPFLSLSPNASGSNPVDKALTSDPQLRKIMYGESVYPRLSRQELQSKHSSSSTTPSMAGGPLTPTSTSAIQIGMSYLATYGDDFSAAHILSPSKTVDTTSDDYDSNFSVPSTRPPSPIAESVFFSSSTGPGHNQFDPSFYGSQKVPPVPPLPPHLLISHSTSYSRSRGSRGLAAASLPPTPTSAVSRTFQLQPSSSMSATFPPQSQSTVTAPMARNASAPSSRHQARNDDAADDDLPGRHVRVSPERAESIRSVASVMSRRSVAVRRPLPRLPSVPHPLKPDSEAIPHTAPVAALSSSRSTQQMAPLPVARRTQSSTQLRGESGSRETGVIPPVPIRPSPRPQRSLPQPPSAPVIAPVATPTPTPLDTAENRRGDGDKQARSEGATSAVAATAPSTTVPASPSLPVPPNGGPLEVYGRRPPITKVSQEDLTNWVHLLTTPQRDLPPDPLPSTSIYDIPPPAYESINFRSRETTPAAGSGQRRRHGTSRRRAATQAGPS